MVTRSQLSRSVTVACRASLHHPNQGVHHQGKGIRGLSVVPQLGFQHLAASRSFNGSSGGGWDHSKASSAN